MFDIKFPRTVSYSSGWRWINEGFRYFSPYKNIWILSLFLIVLVLIAVKFLVPVLQIIILFLLPFVTAGLSLACADIEQNKKMSLEYLLSGFNSPNRLNLFRYGLLLMLMIIVAQMVSTIILTMMGVSQEQLVSELQTLQENSNATFSSLLESEVMSKFLLVSALSLLPVIAINLFAPIILVFSNYSAFYAIKLSFLAVLRNLPAIIVYAVIYILLLVIMIFATDWLGNLLVSLLGNQSAIAIMIYSLLFYSLIFVLGAVSYSSAYVAFKDIFLGESL